MVQAPINPSALSERQKVIEWLASHNYPALPVAPALSPQQYHKVQETKHKQGNSLHCPLTADLQPIPLYTGKNPSYLDSQGVPHLINHRQYQTRLPNPDEIEAWFAHPSTGVGTLGGWNNTVWLDFDVKQFPSQQECDAAVLKILEEIGNSPNGWRDEEMGRREEVSGNTPPNPSPPDPYPPTFIERTHSGGWRIGVRVKQKPDFTNFSLAPGGSHVGEALFEGRFTVLAPTLGASGNPYRSIRRAVPVEVESLESIGIYPTKRGVGTSIGGRPNTETGRHPDTPTNLCASPHLPQLDASSSQSPTPAEFPLAGTGALPFSEGTSVSEAGGQRPTNQRHPVPSPHSPFPIPDSIPLELLGYDSALEILHGACPTGDRSEALTKAAKEWYGWQNWAYNNGIAISGDATTLAHHAGTQLGLDSDRIDRILHTIDPTSCQPAALYRGGEESCWKKISRLDKVTFTHLCPAHIKDAISTEWGSGSGNGGGFGGKRRSSGSFNDDDSGDGENSNAENRHEHAHHSSIAVKLPSKKLPDGAANKMKKLIKDIILQDLPPSELQLAKIQVKTALSGTSEREIQRLFESLEQELELEESRSSRRSEVDDLLKLGDQSLNLSEFLPPDLAGPLTQLSESLNIRPEVCLTSLLVATSSLHKTQTELVIHQGQSFSVPPTIFAGVVSESGQKKSPLLKAIVKKPLSVLQREKRERFASALAEYEKDIASWDKCKSEERSAKFPNGKPKLPQQRLYYFTNATGEGILYQFQAHPDKALLALVDELAGLFASQNKYTGGRGSDRQDILSAFDGTGATVLRAAGTKADLDGLLLSICGTIQPEVLKRLMRDCSDPDGQWARFLFVNQPLAAATLSDDEGGSIDLTGRLTAYYRALDRLPSQKYRLTREAFKRYQPVYNQLERLRVSHPSPGMRAVYSKMEGYIGRLALNLHVLHELSKDVHRSSSIVHCNLTSTTNDARCKGAHGRWQSTMNNEQNPISSEIGLEVMEKAIALAKFYIGQVKLIHANCAADLGELAPHLVKVVELSKRMDATTGNSWIKAKVVQTGYDSSHRPRPDAVRSWFRELEALGIGTTKGAGIRLEYSWKLPDLDSTERDSTERSPNVSPNVPIDEDDPPRQPLVEKVEKSGEKWITSPPTESPLASGFTEKEEKVDNPTHLTTAEGSKLTDEIYTPARKTEDINSHHYLGDQQQNPLEEDLRSQSGLSECEHTSSLEPEPSVASLQEQFAGITDSTSPLSGCDDGVEPTEAVDTQSTFSPRPASVSTGEEGVEPDGKFNKEEATRDKAFSLRSPSLKEMGAPSAGLISHQSSVMIHTNDQGLVTNDSSSLRDEVQSDELSRSTDVSSVERPSNQPKESNDSRAADAGVGVRWKVVLNTTALPQNLVISDSAAEGTPPGGEFKGALLAQASGQELFCEGTGVRYHQVLVTVEELEVPLELSLVRSESIAGTAFIESASGHTDEGELTRTGTNALSLLTLVASAIQSYCLSKVVRRPRDLQESAVAAESKANAPSQATETGAKIDQFKAGDRAHWVNCPTYCEEFGPFEIMWIEGEYAKLDLFPISVPLSELLRPD